MHIPSVFPPCFERRVVFVYVCYTYDAWGNILSVTGSMANTLRQYNPFRYRGYYYDSDDGNTLSYEAKYNLINYLDLSLSVEFEFTDMEKLKAFKDGSGVQLKLGFADSP